MTCPWLHFGTIMTQKSRAPGLELGTSKLRRTQTEASTTSVAARCKRHRCKSGLVFLYESLHCAKCWTPLCLRYNRVWLLCWVDRLLQETLRFKTTYHRISSSKISRVLGRDSVPVCVREQVCKMSVINTGPLNVWVPFARIISYCRAFPELPGSMDDLM